MMHAMPDDQVRESSETRTPLVLALDIGTSSVRAAVFDASAREIENTMSRIERTLCTTQDGGAEINADEAAAQVAQAIDNTLARFDAANLNAEIEIVATSCFWHSLVGVDGEGRAATPVYGWADTRAVNAAEELKRRFDERATHARTGCRFHSSYWPAKLLWLSAEQSDVYKTVARWMSFGEYVALRFFGETAVSVSMASGTGLLVTRTCTWDAELLAGLGLSSEKLSRLANSDKTFTRLTENYARRWPRLRHARWFPALGDGAANNIGEGCVTSERAALMIGTSGAIRVMHEGELSASIPPELWCYRADSRRTVCGGALSDGGGLYHWMSATLAFSHEAKAAEDALAAMEPDAHGLTLLPFWAGERSTGWSAAARGAILGFTMHTQPLDILRAAMEAVAYRFALIARALCALATQTEIFASGGALHASPVWTQMLADVLNRQLTLSAVHEASSRGAVLHALEATGTIKNIADIDAPRAQTFDPEATRHARYMLGLERQEKLYARLISDAEAASIIGETALNEPHTDKRRC
jgi:gluconokinase